jgi:hypothetical protein
MGKKLMSAYAIGVGNTFMWKGEKYMVINDYCEPAGPDSIVVRREGSIFDEQFNPYCYVEKVDAV